MKPDTVTDPSFREWFSCSMQCWLVAFYLQNFFQKLESILSNTATALSLSFCNILNSLTLLKFQQSSLFLHQKILYQGNTFLFTHKRQLFIHPSLIMRLEKEMATHSILLSGKSHGRRNLIRLQSTGSWRVGHDWATSLSLFTVMHWRRQWQPTPVFLPGETQGQRSLVGCCLWGHTGSDMTEVDLAAAAIIRLEQFNHTFRLHF